MQRHVDVYLCHISIYKAVFNHECDQKKNTSLKAKYNFFFFSRVITAVERSQNINGFVGSADSFTIGYGAYYGAFHVNIRRIGGIGE